MRRAAVLAGRLAGGLAGTVLLVLLAGCEPAGGDTTTTATSAVPDLAAHADVLELVTAADDAMKQRGTALFQLSGGQQANPVGAGRLAYRESGFDIVVRTLQRQQNIEFRAVGDALFVQPVGELAAAARGMAWVKLARTPINPLTRILGPVMIDAPGKIDPTRTFDLLVAAGDITATERAMLGEAEVTRYTIELDVDELAEHIELSSQGQTRQALVTALRTLADEGKTTLTAQLWLDRHDLPRRVRLADYWSLPTRGPGPAGGLPKIIVNYRDWGKAPGVAPPPAGEVATVPG